MLSLVIIFFSWLVREMEVPLLVYISSAKFCNFSYWIMLEMHADYVAACLKIDKNLFKIEFYIKCVYIRQIHVVAMI